MKTLTEIIKATFSKKQSTAIEQLQHPNFWMYE
jgi:hypothetical protein